MRHAVKFWIREVVDVRIIDASRIEAEILFRETYQRLAFKLEESMRAAGCVRCSEVTFRRDQRIEDPYAMEIYGSAMGVKAGDTEIGMEDNVIEREFIDERREQEHAEANIGKTLKVKRPKLEGR